MVTRDSRLRIGVVGLVSVALFASLFARLWYLQVMKAGTYNEAAQNIATKQVTVPPPRGRILDRNGNVLVGNRSSTVIAVDGQALRQAKDSDAVLSRLAQLINADQPGNPPLTLDTIKARIHSNLVNPLEPVPVAKDVSQSLQIYIVEHPAEFPDVRAVRQTLRYYPYGNLLAQVLGYVGAIPDAKKYNAQFKPAIPYQPNDNVGRAGVEQSFEQYLRGTPGVITYEVDRTGRPVRTLSETPAVPGDDVYLTVDINAQSIVEASLVRELQNARGHNCRLGCPPAPAGASVELDPNNGQVLAMASYPTYDPALFVPAITNADYERLRDADPTPLLNRAVQGQYYPGSTFKLVTALAGLKDGIINPADYYQDTGVYKILYCRGTNAQSGCTKTNAGKEQLGSVDLRLAIAKSSDTYFYKIGDEFWQSENRKRFGDAPIQDMAKEFGFGQKTGIQLPIESPGYVETPATRKQRHDENPEAFPYGEWTSGANTDTAIGQTTLVTPLQLANAYATFANGGTRYQPTLLYKVTKPFSAEVVAQPQPKVLSHIDIPPQFHAPMLAGFEGATTVSGGTATGVFANYPMDALPVAGKTGTAQNGKDQKTGRERQDTGLFVGFGPPAAGSQPQYVAMAVLEQAGFGADTAAPVVRDFFQPLAETHAFPVVPPVNTPKDAARSTTGAGPPPGSSPPTSGGSG